MKENGLDDTESMAGIGSGVDELALFEAEMKQLNDEWEAKLQALREKAERIRVQRLTE
jgi:hypothetical protein